MKLFIDNEEKKKKKAVSRKYNARDSVSMSQTDILVDSAVN